MDELVCVMQEILAELKDMNSKLDDIKGYGIWNSLSDVCDKMDHIRDELDVLEDKL